MTDIQKGGNKLGNIKKMISVILVVVCVFAFTACGKTETLDGKCCSITTYFIDLFCVLTLDLIRLAI